MAPSQPCKCGKKIGVNCSFKFCKSCCLARSPSEPRCVERYHKRDPSSRTPNPTATSRSVSSGSSSTASESSVSTSAPPSASTQTTSSSAASTVSSQPYAQPLHNIWAPAAAEVAIEDRLKHKSRREEVAESQTRLVFGASQGRSNGAGMADGRKTVRFMIWKLAHRDPEQLLVFLKDYPSFTPHDHPDIVSELVVDEHVQPAQLFDRHARAWVVMGAGITCHLSEGEDVVCIRLKGLSDLQCPGLPSWADCKVLGKRPLHPPSVAETVDTSPTKRIRSVALASFSPETTPSLLSSFSLPFPHASGLDLMCDTSGLLSDLSLSGAPVAEDFVSSDIPMPSNHTAVTTPSHTSPSITLPPFPSTYPFRLVLLFALNVLIFASHDGRTVDDTLKFFGYKFGVKCGKANYTSIIRKLRCHTLLEYHSFIVTDMTWKSLTSQYSNRADIPNSALWRSRSVTDWRLRHNGVTPELLAGILGATTTANTWDEVMREYSAIFPTDQLSNLFYCYGGNLFLDGFKPLASAGFYPPPDFAMLLEALQVARNVSSSTPSSSPRMDVASPSPTSPTVPLHAQPGIASIYSLPVNESYYDGSSPDNAQLPTSTNEVQGILRIPTPYVLTPDMDAPTPGVSTPDADVPTSYVSAPDADDCTTDVSTPEVDVPTSYVSAPDADDCTTDVSTPDGYIQSQSYDDLLFTFDSPPQTPAPEASLPCSIDASSPTEYDSAVSFGFIIARSSLVDALGMTSNSLTV